MGGGLLKTQTLNIAEGGFNLADGRVEALNVVGDLTVDAGIYAPGNSPAISSISGDFTQGAGNTLEIELERDFSSDAGRRVFRRRLRGYFYQSRDRELGGRCSGA